MSPSLLVHLYYTVCTRHANIEIRESRLQFLSQFLLVQKLCSGSYETPYSSVKLASAAMVISTPGKWKKKGNLKKKQTKNHLPHLPLYYFLDHRVILPQRTLLFFFLFTPIVSTVLMQLHHLHRKLPDSVVRISIRWPLSKHVYSLLIDSSLAWFSAQCILPCIFSAICQTLTRPSGWPSNQT